jgi:hypothetical protein
MKSNNLKRCNFYDILITASIEEKTLNDIVKIIENIKFYFYFISLILIQITLIFKKKKNFDVIQN